jgi:steroid delta-isomerase-like uncharacterized protein
VLVQRNAVDSLLRRYYAEVTNVWPSPSAQEAVGELLSRDVIFHPPNSVTGVARLDRHKAFLSWHHSAFLKLQFTVEDVVVADDRAACRWILTGTHHGPFLGVEATGRHVEVSGTDFFHVSGDRITEFWRYFDLRGLLKQLEAPSLQEVSRS